MEDKKEEARSLPSNGYFQRWFLDKAQMLRVVWDEGCQRNTEHMKF